MPCDSLWLDIEYMDGYRVFTWDRDRFPDPDAMLERLREEGLHVITIVDPGVKHEPGYAVFDDGRAQGRVLPHRGRRPVRRPGVAGRHRVPRLRHRGGAQVVGTDSTPSTSPPASPASGTT